MRKVPKDIQLLIDGYGDQEKVLYEDDFFLVVEDPKHRNNAHYYYTAWCKEDLRSILDIEIKHLPLIQMLRRTLKMKYHINEINSRQIIHFPPNFWRLHIHFISNELIKDVRCFAPHTHYLRTVISNIQNDEEHYRTHVIIKRHL